jgi:hypothetical protein
MRALDYGRSFVTFVTPSRGNNARLQIESTCTLTDRNTGKATEYLFFASCKSENTYARTNLFHADNYDFCGIFSDEEFVIFRTRSRHTAGFRDQGLWRGRFEAIHRQVCTVETEELGIDHEVVQASLSGVPLIGTVAFKVPDSTWDARLEFPIKTLNANDIEVIWQVDTGPVAWPDTTRPVSLGIESLTPAYVAYNCRTFADFVVQQPLRIADGAAEVTHYSGLVTVPAEARVWAVKSSA